MWLGPCPLGFHSVALEVLLLLPLARLVAVLLQVGHLLQQGVLQLVVLPQADLLLVLLRRQVGLLLPLVGRELAAAVVVVATPFLR
jgi:hypothetical protein